MGDKSVYWSIVMGMTLAVGNAMQGQAQSVAMERRAEPVKLAPVTLDVVDAPLSNVLETIARQSGLYVFWGNNVFDRASRVTTHLRNVPADDAFAKVLSGTGLKAEITARTVAFVRDGTLIETQGSLTGQVLDAKTRQPLAGVNVMMDSRGSGLVTGNDGTFRFPSVAPGSHTVSFRLLGYVRTTKTVTVSEGQTARVDVVLEQSVNALDQVVVTGTVTPTEVKAIPNAITVITAKDIEDRGITRIDQFFRGDVPGVFAVNEGAVSLDDAVTMFSRGATALSSASAGVQRSITNPIKTYVDGIEMTDPSYLSHIDARSIERIEILTGPQASTIYGSNAINGVMQIFTKRGNTPRPQLTLNLLSGFVQNNVSDALTPQHDYSAQLSGIEGRLSYSAGGTYSYVGPWTPAKQTMRYGGNGGARLEYPTSAGRITADASLRLSNTQNLTRGASPQIQTLYRQTGWYVASSTSGLVTPTTRTQDMQAMGITLAYEPTSWWRHSLQLSDDKSDWSYVLTSRGYSTPNDTTLQLQQGGTDLRQLQYRTTARLALSPAVNLELAGGADNWQSVSTSINARPQSLTGTLSGTTTVTRNHGHNTGAFLQTQLGVYDALFVTYGMRLEWNPTYGDEAQPNYSPRYGAAYTRAIGDVTAKIRASYGRTTRPPQANFKDKKTISQYYAGFGTPAPTAITDWFGDYDYYLANPDLAPEHQQGTEGGMELYFGNRGSFQITRYNQTVDGLIAQPKADSLRSSVPCTACQADIRDIEGYGWRYQYAYLNIGSIRNQGWELQGTLNLGPVATRGAYSWTKSRTIGVNPRYRASFAGQPQYRPGATFQYLAEHTWAINATYSEALVTVGLNLRWTGPIVKLRNDYSVQYLDSGIRLPNDRVNVSNTPYINFSSSYTMADITASRRFSSRVEGLLQVQNLGNYYLNDYTATTATLGRQTKVGLRCRF